MGLIALAFSLWIYGKTQSVNEAMLRAQTEIGATTTVVKGLVDGLLGTTWEHMEF